MRLAKHILLGLLVSLVWFSSADAGLLEQWGVGSSSGYAMCDNTSPTCDVGVGPITLNTYNDGIGYSGGVRTGIGQNNANGNGWAASSITSVGYHILQLRGAVYASSTGIVQTSAWGVDALVYTGSEPITLTISSELFGEISNPIGSDLTYMSVAMAVLMPSQVEPLATTDLQPFIGSELTPFDFSSVTLLSTGSVSMSVSFDLNPGDTFYLWSSLQLSAAAGGSALTTQNFTYSFSEGSSFNSLSLSMLPIPGAIWMFGSALVILVGRNTLASKRDQ